MKKFNIDDIRGGEVLGNSIIVSKYQILLTEGTILKKEYIENLKELGVTEVYIQEENIKSNNQETEDKNIEIGLRCKTQVKNILERHIYQKNTDLIKLNDTATFIIDNILQEDSITDKLLEIKERNTDLYEHSLNCCVLSIILGIRLNLSNETIHAVGVGCLLHDMGLRFIAVDYNNIILIFHSGNVHTDLFQAPEGNDLYFCILILILSLALLSQSVTSDLFCCFILHALQYPYSFTSWSVTANPRRSIRLCSRTSSRSSSKEYTVLHFIQMA